VFVVRIVGGIHRFTGKYKISRFLFCNPSLPAVSFLQRFQQRFIEKARPEILS
jgi:hypothetical protein